MNKRLLTIALCLILCVGALFALSSCSGQEEDLPKIEGVTFKGATFNYDGQPKKIEVSGVPEGATVVYSPGNTYTNAGEYSIKATITLDGYETLEISAMLIIKKPETKSTATVTFDTNGATSFNAETTVEVELGEAVSEPTASIFKNGYSFTGWYLDGDKFDFSTPIEEDTTLTAGWNIINYNITYNVGFGTNAASNPTSYNAETDDIILAPATAVSGSEFDYWYTVGTDGEVKITTITKGTIGNITIYAKYKYEDYDITYNLDGGTNASANPATSNAVTGAIPLGDASKRGYDFVGWYTTASCNASSKVTEIPANLGYDLELWAKFEPTEYDISYTLCEPSELPSGTRTSYTVLDSYTLPTLQDRTDYSFGGWMLGSAPITEIAAGTVDNLTLSAVWTPKTYNVTYNMGGGTNNSGNIGSFTVETATFTLLAPTRDYYTFAGWTDGSNNPVTVIANGTSGNITLNANWTPVPYSITYVLNGGTNDTDNPDTYTVESNITLNKATRTGYKFLGWYTEDNTTSTKIENIATGSHGNKTLYAQWEEYSFTIKYIANGGTLPKDNPTGFDPAVGVSSFAPATRKGSTFIGWYTTSTFDEGTLITKIDAGTEQNFVLYAKFVEGSEGLQYTLSGSTYTVSGYNGTDTVVYIPATWDGKTVTAIANGVFSENTSITEVKLTTSLTTIGAEAFKNCTALNKTVIPSSVTTIGANAFFGCTALEVINCKATSKPAGYDASFNTLDANSSIRVVYGYKDDADNVLPIQPLQ